jgi:hypothetical protein
LFNLGEKILKKVLGHPVEVRLDEFKYHTINTLQMAWWREFGCRNS